jgi:hypothetical protein
MPEQPIEIRIRIPNDLGLSPTQVADLKEKVRVEIVASTVPAHGFTVKTPQQVMIQLVDGPPVHN